MITASALLRFFPPVEKKREIVDIPKALRPSSEFIVDRFASLAPTGRLCMHELKRSAIHSAEAADTAVGITP